MMGGTRWIHISFMLLLVTSMIPTFGQDVVVRGGFMADSMRVGDQVFFYLSARAPKTSQVIFPDSSFDYRPFEFVRKKYFNTTTKDSISLDSAVYYLSTFEVDSTQTLKLPVYRVNALDCTAYYTTTDTVRLQLMVRRLPDEISANLPVRATIGYQNVPVQINYPVIVVGISLTLVLAAVIWFSFGERIQRHYRVRHLKRSHAQFMAAFDNKITSISNQFSREHTEEAVTLWKKYMESINRLPYTKLTTSEIRAAGKDEPLIPVLQKLDSIVYGHNHKLNDAFSELRRYTEERFEEMIKEQTNG